jgi:hypothetical protein
VVVGRSLSEVVIRSVYLELSAKLQAQSIALAGPQGTVTYFDEAETRETTARQDAAGTWERVWTLWREKARADMNVGMTPATKRNIAEMWRKAVTLCTCLQPRKSR